MHRFFHNSILVGLNTLDQSESKHAVSVLRLQVGDLIELTDGKGSDCIARISDIVNKQVVAIVDQVNFVLPQWSKFHLCIAPTKQMERMEWLVEKACELGVGKVSFMISQHTIRPLIKLDRLEKITLAAIKQSGCNWKPELATFNSVRNCYDSINSNAMHFLCQQVGSKFQEYVIQSDVEHVVWVGPEGDFSQNEVDFFREKSVSVVSLNGNRLRTETAGLQAISALHWLCV